MLYPDFRRNDGCRGIAMMNNVRRPVVNRNMTTPPNKAGMIRASQTSTLRHFARMFLLGTALATLLLAVAALLVAVVISWGLAAWFGENAPQWQKWLDAVIALWLLLLNSANFSLTPFIAIIGLGDETCDFTGPFGPDLFLIAAFGAGFLASAAAVVAITLAPPLAETLRGWLWLLSMTNILLAAGLAVVTAVSPLSGQTRRSACALVFIHAASIAAFLLSVAIARPSSGVAGNLGEIELSLLWIAPAAGLLLLIFLNRRKIGSVSS